MLRWRRCVIAERKDTGAMVTKHDNWLYAAAAVFGLALGDHHITVGLTLPAVAVIVYKTQGLRFFTSRRLAYAALISIAALIAVYAYLPLDRKSTRLNSSHGSISYAVFCLKKKNQQVKGSRLSLE